MKSRRLPWLLAVLAGIGALAAFGDAPVATVAAAPSPPQSLAADRGAFIRALAPRADHPGNGTDPFQAAAPAAQPLAAAPAVSPAPTPAPPPYRVIGKQQAEGEGWTVFLARGDETWVVREGDSLGDDYRVATIKPPQLTLQHARNKTRRTLDIGEAQE